MGDESPFSYGRSSRIPPGIRLLEHFLGFRPSYSVYQVSVLVLTFLSYTCFHAARKPPSIVKSILNADNNGLHRPLVPSLGNINNSTTPFPWNQTVETPQQNTSTFLPVNKSILQHTRFYGWKPFTGNVGKALLGDLDVGFLACYSLGMYFSGHLGDRVDLRLFLWVGMVGSGLFTLLFGMGYFWNIHILSYYMVIQMISGLFQSTGWPSVVAIMANWYGKEKRGLVFGIWNSHTSIGNILGSLLSSAVISWGWGWSFILPGLTIATLGFTNLFFLVPHPEVLGLKPPQNLDVSCSSPSSEESSDSLLSPSKDKLVSGEEASRKLLEEGNGVSVAVEETTKAVGFFEAWKIPGVASFAICLFFAKLVAYTFLYWLPFYISHTEIAGVHLDSTSSGILSTVFDVGGIFGGIMAGHLSDSHWGQATVAASFMTLAIPTIGAYFLLGHISLPLNIFLLAICGFFVNGPYALITCAVSADLGQHSSLRGNSRALATVTAIIDGTGSVGAAIGPFLTGLVAEMGGDGVWDFVFLMLMGAALLSVLCLVRNVRNEWFEKLKQKEENEAGETSVTCRLKRIEADHSAVGREESV